jgi:hypothetical protein
METLTNETYRDVLISVDGKTFEKCVFDQATLVYAGGDLPVFKNCKFNNISLQYGKAAADTLRVLAELKAAGFGASVNNLIDRVKTGSV